MADFDIKQVQHRLFKMAVCIKNIFEANDIPYMIAFGSLLGAVRHKGFIPWDDDFDFILFDDSYKKANDVLKDNLPKDMFLENEDSEPLFFHGWSRVKDLHSICQYQEHPIDSAYSHKGLSIDLFMAKEMTQKELFEYRTKEHIAYLSRKKQHHLITPVDYEEKVKELNNSLILNHPDENDNEKILALNLNYDKISYKNVFPLKKILFENELFYGPNNPSGVLSYIYGDFMALPKEENRKPHYSHVQFI